MKKGTFLPLTIDRILTHVSRYDRTGCWNWTRGVNKAGYGTIRWKKEKKLVHRLVSEFIRGATDLCVLHRCDNRLCCNPLHTFHGTKKENAQDAVKKGRVARGERTGSSVLKNEQVLKIASDKRSWRLISAEFGVGHSVISAIRTGKTWGWLTGIKHMPNVDRMKKVA